MRNPIRVAGILAILAAPLLARAEEPPLPKRTLPTPVPPVIGTHQIDRYEAISKLQQTLKENPKSLADWVILGELAHEVAHDLPSDQAAQYYRMSRDAYEKALALDPDNPGLKAAVQFAQDQEAESTRFEAARHQAAATYLDARRRDLAATNYAPSLRVYGTPGATSLTPTTAIPGTAAYPPTGTTTTAPAAVPGRAPNPLAGTPGTTPATVPQTLASPPNPVTPASGLVGASSVVGEPAETNAPSTETATANFGTRQIYSAPTYREYYVPQGSPYTFKQFSNGYYVPSTSLNPALLPMTVQRYSQQVPQRVTPSPVR